MVKKDILSVIRCTLERIADKRATQEAISQIINSPDFNRLDAIGIEYSPSDLENRAKNSPGFKKIKAEIKKVLLSSIQASLEEGFGVGGGQQQLPENPSLLSQQTVLSPQEIVGTKTLKELKTIKKGLEATMSEEQIKELLTQELRARGRSEEEIPAILAEVWEMEG